MRNFPVPAPNRLSDMSGFTLVELMVSSIILGLTVSAIAVMIINSSVVRIGNDHNRQARIIAQEELEDTRRHFFRYNAPPPPLVNSPIKLDPGEERNTPAMRNLPITTHNFNITVAFVTVSVPYKKLASTVTWTDETIPKSVTLTKWITNVK